ncbi:MAG: 50S ribosomal protein L21e [Thermoplasmata archaeon]|nr:50S ribosomal protein L21e [Thermoplasmata archaeon]
MVKSSKGIRKRTRNILRKSPRHRGMPPITHSFIQYEVGEKAAVVIDPSVHKGQPHVSFHGKTGTIVGKQGKAYMVHLGIGKHGKDIIVGPEHLKKQVF